MKSAKLPFLVLTFALGLVLAGSASATIWIILPDGTGDAPTIQEGINLAEIGDTVQLGRGIFYEHDIVMKAGITLTSESGTPDCATIDAQELGRVILCEDLDLEASIIGITITGGHRPAPDYYGGGIHCIDAWVTITDCDFVANYSGYAGGGLNIMRGIVTVARCRFVENEAYMSGGGIFCYDSDAEIIRCVFEHNVSTDGAGLQCQRASPDVEWCTFLGNDGQFFGGAIFCHIEASPNIRNCSLVGNDAYVGAGIMTVARSFPVMENCIIAFSTLGEAVHCNDDQNDSTYVEVSCTNVFGNEGGAYTGQIEDQTGLNGNIADDPRFCDLEGEDIQLDSASPCLPANNDCGVLMGALAEGCIATPVPEELPAAAVVLRGHPNPFNPRTTVSFAVDRATWARVSVHDATGSRVTVLAERAFVAGSHSLTWDGRDIAGRALPSGAYLVRLESGIGVQTAKLMLVR